MAEHRAAVLDNLKKTFAIGFAGLISFLNLYNRPFTLNAPYEGQVWPQAQFECF